MIPKIIHYCWFGHGLMPQSQKSYIQHWTELMPDWEFKRWDESNFDVDFCPYTSEAYARKKYAFVSDVARLYALVNYGGIYLDTDVELFSSLEPYLHHRAFSGIEIYHDDYENNALPLLDNEYAPKTENAIIPCCGLLTALMGSESHNPFFEDCLNAYSKRQPIKDNNEFNYIIINHLMAPIAVKYGYRYKDEFQRLPDMTIYPSHVFAFDPDSKKDDSVAYHHMAWSWNKKTKKQKIHIWLDKLGLTRKNIRKIYTSLFKK